MFGKGFKEKVLSVFGAEVFFRCAICVRLCLFCVRCPVSGVRLVPLLFELALCNGRFAYSMLSSQHAQRGPLFILLPDDAPINHGLHLWYFDDCKLLPIAQGNTDAVYPL